MSHAGDNGGFSVRLISIVTVLFFCGLSAASADAYKEFKDFNVSCSVAMTCTIQTLAKAPKQPPVNAFSLLRKAGPDTPLDILVAAQDELSAGSDIRLSVDGKQVLILPVAKGVRGENTEYTFAGGADSLKLLEALRNASKLEIAYTAKGGPGTSSFSLSGLVAALIFTDEIQGRLKAKDALQVKGDGTSPAAAVREIATVADIPEAIRDEFKGPDGTCSFSDDDGFDNIGGFDADVGDDAHFLVLPCGDGGAYNQPYAFFANQSGSIDQMALPDMAPDGPTTTSQAWNIDWDQQKRILTAFFKGRGLGDCGGWNKWRLDNGGEGLVFVLLEARSKDDCDGNYDNGPENWPAAWPVGKK